MLASLLLACLHLKLGKLMFYQRKTEHLGIVEQLYHELLADNFKKS